MAKIDIGTDGTLKSDAAEGKLQELCTLLQMGEFNLESNPTGIDNIVGNHFQNTETFSTTFTIPVEQTISADGHVVYATLDYLNAFPFSPGTNGTFKSTTCAGYFVEVVIYIQNLERSVVHNPDKINNVTGTFNSDSTVFSGSINLPVDVSIDDMGRVVYAAREYLLTYTS